MPNDELFASEVHLLCELCLLQDSLWPRRLRLLVTIFFKGMQQRQSSLVCERLLLPCLRLIARLALPTGGAAGTPSRAPWCASSVWAMPDRCKTK